jgi:hypothetical protein
MLPLRFLTGEFNHPGHQKSTILVVTRESVSQPYAHVSTEISYPGSRKFGLADDEGLAFALGLSALPKTTHLGT